MMGFLYGSFRVSFLASGRISFFLLFKLARKFRDMQFFLVFCFLRITIDFLSNSHFLSNDSCSDVAFIFSLHILPFLPLFQIFCCSSLIRIS